MQVTHVKKHRRNSRRSRRRSMRKTRVLSAVTSIGSFEPEMIENPKESNLNNIDSTTSDTNNTSVSLKSQQTKTNRPPTTTKSIVRVFPSQPSSVTTNQSPNEQKPMSDYMQTTLHHPIHRACLKLRLDQISKHSLLSQTQVHPNQASSSSGDYDQTNAENLSKNSFFIRNNSDSPNRTQSDRFAFDTNENNNQEKSYLTEPINKTPHPRRLCNGFCRCCSPCCCLFTGLVITLLLAGLATLVTLLTLSKSTTTTTTTTTTVTTTTTTSTTTTVTTSTTTSTTTTTTTTSTSTSTSTSSMSTSVTITTTTTTAATTVTITSNACTSTWNGVTVFNLCTNCSNINPYQQYAYSYLAIATVTRITFALRNDAGYFALDDVSVRNISEPTIELLINGGFETGVLSPWIYCNPAGSAYPGIIKSTSDNFFARGQTYAAHGGNYYYLDGAVGNADYLSQTWQTNIGETYNISFWLYNQGSGSNSIANIIISI